jgi:hypothetical protein
VVDGGRTSREFIGGCGRSEDGRSLRFDAARRSEKYRQRLRKRQDFLEEILEVEDEFVSNIPQGADAPPSGTPWIYYMFTADMVRLEKRTEVFRDVLVLRGDSRKEVNEALLELVTRPGVAWKSQ